MVLQQSVNCSLHLTLHHNPDLNQALVQLRFAKTLNPFAALCHFFQSGPRLWSLLCPDHLKSVGQLCRGCLPVPLWKGLSIPRTLESRSSLTYSEMNWDWLTELVHLENLSLLSDSILRQPHRTMEEAEQLLSSPPDFFSCFQLWINKNPLCGVIGASHIILLQTSVGLHASNFRFTCVWLVGDFKSSSCSHHLRNTIFPQMPPRTQGPSFQDWKISSNFWAATDEHL